MAPDLSENLALAEVLADEARAILTANTAPPPASFKADRSFVTELDLTIERRLRAILAEQRTDHGVLGEEEEADRADADWVWVLDPIDGTAAFVAGMPVYGTLIALAYRGAPVLGVIDFPTTRERWVGAQGHPTRLNGATCETRRGLTLSGCIQSASNPDFFPPAAKPVLEAVSRRTAWRIFGGAALSYGRLASGRIDLAVDTGLKVHDYAAFVPIIEGAGGVITDWDGQPLGLGSGSHVLAAGDPAIHREALAIVRGAEAENR